MIRRARSRHLLIGLLLTTCTLVGCNPRLSLPRWRVNVIGFGGDWELAPAIVVGALGPGKAVGTQKIDKAPWPVYSDVHLIYWCIADFQTYAVVRGSTPAPGKKFLWASPMEGCSMEGHTDGRRWGNEPIVEVWFLREEGDFLRPIVDVGAIYFVTLHARWNYQAPDPVKQFGELLLSPEALAKTDDELVGPFFHIASRGCQVLGADLCIPRILDMSKRGNAGLRTAACNFLQSQYDVPCR